MPVVSVAVWNIQNYGSTSELSRLKWGHNYTLLNGFVVEFVRQHALDILFIEEVLRAADNALGNLNLQLNAAGIGTWAVSFCGSALARDSAFSPTSPNDISYTADARSEGYAICWRTDRAVDFTLAARDPSIAAGTFGPAGAIPPSPLGLVTYGRPTDVSEQPGVPAPAPAPVPAGPGPIRFTRGAARQARAAAFAPYGAPPVAAPRFFQDPNADRYGEAIGGFTAPGPYPYGPRTTDGRTQRDYAAINPWPALDFPTTSSVDWRRLKRTSSRRPAFVVLQRTATPDGPAKSIPIAAYHAPSARALAERGVTMAALARELYATPTVDGTGVWRANAPMRYVERSVLAGDFNLAVYDGLWATPANTYDDFLRPFRQDRTGGAACNYAPQVQVGVPGYNQASRCTTVRIQREEGESIIIGPNADQYLSLPIDLIFHRGDGAHLDVSQRVNLFGELMQPGALYGPALAQFAIHFMQQQANVTARRLLRPDRVGDMEISDSGPFYLTNVTMAANARQSIDYLATAPPDTPGEVAKAARYNQNVKPIFTGGWGSRIEDWARMLLDLQAGFMSTPRQAAQFYRVFISDHLPVMATLDI